MDKIFMTGITGLVGSGFVTALLKDRPDVRFVCLARGGKNRTAMDRVVEAMKSECEFEGIPERFEEIMRHIEVVDGDIVSMDPAAVAALPACRGVSQVFHCAADVNLGKDPTGRTFRINYNGTEHMLETARLMKADVFHYVSTAYVAGKSRGVSPEGEVPDNGFNNPYEESKFKAENMVRHSGFPFTIYRPAIITGRRSDGRIRKPLAVYRLLEFVAKMKSHTCAKRGIDPTQPVDIGLHFHVVPSDRIYFSPIDYVQYAITKCFQLPVSNQTYHVTGNSPVSTQMIEDAVTSLLRLDNVTVGTTEKEVTTDERLIERLLGDLFPYFSADVIFSQENITKAIGADQVNWEYGRPGLQKMMLAFYRDFFRNTDWVQTLLANRA